VLARNNQQVPAAQRLAVSEQAEMFGFGQGLRLALLARAERAAGHYAHAPLRATPAPLRCAGAFTCLFAIRMKSDMLTWPAGLAADRAGSMSTSSCAGR
jgi:hypothetical protein